MKAVTWFAACISCVPLCYAQTMDSVELAQTQRTASEADYLAEVPTVMSVSRIAQSLEDTPGAVTILDRDFIRMTGARDVVSVLAFVPGFQTTTSFETDAPMASYHGRSDDYANRIQVLVDGRSVYSGLLQGSAGMGWMALALDDIDRIEILRGSNSATYGARAFLGVVNIISRDVRETLGFSASATNGGNGVDDRGMRLGWKDGDATYRLSADRAADNGLTGAFGHNNTERVNFSSHVVIDARSDVDVRAGGVGVYAGRGNVADAAGNPARMHFTGSQFAQADWHYLLDDASDVALGYSHTENVDRDRFLYMSPGPYFQATVDFSGAEYVDRLTLQRSTRHSADLRTVVGAELERELDISPSSFDQFGQVTSSFVRLFGSAEWRLSPQWLVNVGAMAEHSDLGGDNLSPRLMVNWQVAPGHTLRLGGTTAFRPPSAYEKFSQVQYYDVNGANPTGYYVYNNGTATPEKLVSKELGYFYGPADLRLNADVRLFSEQIIEGISHVDQQDPALPATQYVNTQQYQINGVEWQLQWMPASATRLYFSQTWTSIPVSNSLPGEILFRTQHSAARYASSLVLGHTLDNGVQVSVMYQAADDVALMSISNNPWLSSMQRTDLRVAREFKLGRSKVEAALTLQNLNSPYQDGDWKYLFQQRALFNVKIDY